MIVLGFDTATAATAVALRSADGLLTQARDDPPPGEHPGHATRLLDMSHRLLADAGLGWSAVQRIAVGVGPGTFTGLRVGVATARGLAQSLALELAGVSSLHALAFAVLAAPISSEPAGNGVLAVIDARRGEVFAAAYADRGDGTPVELTVPRALPPARLAGVLAEAEQADAAPRSWLSVGDGALRFPAQLPPAAPCAPASSPLHRVSATAICELGVHAPVAAIEDILPDYRRRPDAELALEGVAAASATGPGPAS